MISRYLLSSLLSPSVFFVLSSTPLQGTSIVLPPPVFDNGVSASDINNGRVNDADFAIYIEHADNFEISVTSEISAVSWSGLYKGNAAHLGDDFVMRIFRTESGIIDPVALLDTSLTVLEKSDSGDDVLSMDVYTYVGEFPTISLDLGTYAISIYNNASNVVEWTWGINATPDDGSYMTQFDPTNWTPVNPGAPEFSFALYNSVPEPSVPSVLLATVGLLLTRRTR
jgi:hypothetical protein